MRLDGHTHFARSGIVGNNGIRMRQRRIAGEELGFGIHGNQALKQQGRGEVSEQGIHSKLKLMLDSGMALINRRKIEMFCVLLHSLKLIRYEKDISAFPQKKEKQARIPFQDVVQGRSRSDQCQKVERSQKTDRLRREAP